MKVKDAKTKMKLWIGQVNLMGRWLDKHQLPYKKDEVVIIPDEENANVLAYEFTLDQDSLKPESLEELAPDVLKSGIIKVTFYI